MNIRGNIKELRITESGGYDFECGCWLTDAFLIITDQTIYCFRDDEKHREEYYSRLKPNEPDEYAGQWVITELVSYDGQEFRYKLRTFTDHPLSFDSYCMDKEDGETLVLQYEDIYLNIFTQSYGGILFTLRECSDISTRQIVDKDEIKSKYVTWDDYEEYYRIEFVDDDGKIYKGL